MFPRTQKHTLGRVVNFDVILKPSNIKGYSILQITIEDIFEGEWFTLNPYKMECPFYQTDKWRLLNICLAD